VVHTVQLLCCSYVYSFDGLDLLTMIVCFILRLLFKILSELKVMSVAKYPWFGELQLTSIGHSIHHCAYVYNMWFLFLVTASYL